MNSPPVRPGDIVADKYRVDRVLGEGGMGFVVAATHVDLLEPRALKFMNPAAIGEAEAAPRFLREARAAARLKSEHIAKVYDVGKLDSGVPYMVMEYLEGSDLDVLLKLHGTLPPPVAALYALQACAALAEAHAAGIVHRDLKPANLFLTQRTDGSPCIKVLDFGISKITTPGLEGVVTRTQEILGSPYFMSPEQMRSTRNVDARTDIWSLGIILYKMVTGRVPFHTKNITELVSMVLELAPAPPSILGIVLPPGFEAVILRCLRRNREQRYPNVVELAGELAGYAPPGAGAMVEAMARVFAAGPSARGSSSAALMEGPRTAGTSFGSSASGERAGAPATVAAVTSGVIGSGSGGVVGPVRPAMAALSAGEPTSASWGKTSRRAGSRSAVSVVVGVIGAVVVLGAVVIGVVWWRGARSEDGNRAVAAEGTAAPVRETVETAVTVVPTVVASAPGVVAAVTAVTAAPVMSSSAGVATVGSVAVAGAAPSASGTGVAKEGMAGKEKSAPAGGRTAAPTGRRSLGAPPIF